MDILTYLGILMVTLVLIVVISEFIRGEVEYRREKERRIMAILERLRKQSK